MTDAAVPDYAVRLIVPSNEEGYDWTDYEPSTEWEWPFAEHIVHDGKVWKKVSQAQMTLEEARRLEIPLGALYEPDAETEATKDMPVLDGATDISDLSQGRW